MQKTGFTEHRKKVDIFLWMCIKFQGSSLGPVLPRWTIVPGWNVHFQAVREKEAEITRYKTSGETFP
jgi:hypothetical protein